jgi:hypothetical protein
MQMRTLRRRGPETSARIGTHETDARPALEIAHHGLHAAPAIEERALRAAAGLQRVAPDLVRSRLTLARSNRRHRQGSVYEVRLDLTIPGREIVVSERPTGPREDETLISAIDGAYAKARRALIEARRKAVARRPRAVTHG